MRETTQVKALLVSDLVGSTQLTEDLGDAKAAAVFRSHDAIARDLLENHSGREIDKSDGFLLLFERPGNAVQYALAYQNALLDLSRESGISLNARVGIHYGEVVLRESPPGAVAKGAKPLDVEGLAKPIAARLMSLGGARQILLSRAAYEMIRQGRIAEDSSGRMIEWRIHGPYRLAGVTDPVEVCEVGLAGFAPLTAPRGSDKAQRIGTGRPGIVVLPFSHLSGVEDSDYVSDGLTDEIITSLSGVQGIRVISRGASMQLKGQATDARKLSRELNVDYVLDGAVRGSKNDLRISAQLVRAGDNEVLWAKKYRGLLDELFDIEEQIARNVLEALKVHLDRREDRNLADRPIPDVAAYEYYLRAKQQIYKFTGEALDRALEYLEHAHSILGDNVLLLAATGYVYWQYVNAGVRPDPENLSKARDCAERIFAIDPYSADGHRLMGLVETHAKGDFQKTARHLKLALARNTNDTDALFWLSLIYGFAGRSSSGYPLVERLLEIDPLTSFHWLMPGYLALLDGDFERARPAMLKAHRLNKDNPAVGQAYGQLLIMSGQTQQGLEVFNGLTAEFSDSYFTKLGECYVQVLSGEGGTVSIASELSEGAATDAQYSWSLAQCCAIAGDVAQGTEWLSNAVRCGFWNYPLLAERDPLLENLRSEGAYQQLMLDLKQKWMSFEV